jgi:hypothetical protein
VVRRASASGDSWGVVFESVISQKAVEKSHRARLWSRLWSSTKTSIIWCARRQQGARRDQGQACEGFFFFGRFAAVFG